VLTQGLPQLLADGLAVAAGSVGDKQRAGDGGHDAARWFSVPVVASSGVGLAEVSPSKPRAHFNLFPHKSVLANITLGLRTLRGLSRDEAETSALTQLDRVGLRHKAQVRPGTLSGGQQQRVAIARALAMSPEVMLFDEATSALDPELVKGVLATIADLAGEGMTMLVVTHEMGFARGVADTVHFMDGGRVVESGPPEQLFEAAASRRLQQFLSQVL
jgi:polar amino acid transport system ATP-binding protein